MLKEKRLVPQLRFSEFENDRVDSIYRKHNFKDIFNFSTGKNIKQSEALPEFEIPCVRYGELYHMYNEVIYEVINRTDLDKSELLFSKGDEILLPSAGEDPIDIGSASSLTFKNVAIGRTINILRPQKVDVYCQNYAAYYISNKLRRKISTLAKGSSISNVYNSDLKKLEIILPNLSEQQKIASFLTVIDNRIQTLEKKEALLKQYKKGVMQKIFNQELRLKDEEGNTFPNWKLKRIGEVFKERNEKNFKDMELLSVSIGKGIYSQSKSNKKDNSNSDKSKYKRVLKDDIAYNSMRMWQGASAVSEYDGIVSPAYTILEGNEYQYSIFYGYLFKMSFMIQIFQKHSQGLTSDTWNLKYPMISKIKINVPSLEEQTKISNLLSAIDKNIELVTKKMEHTKTFKKGLLQQMFV
jgi:type I restriction enzyme S subunit